MPLNTNTEYARLIPSLIWKSDRYFNSSLSDNLIALIEASTDEALDTQLRKVTASNEIRDRRCAWLVINLRTPQLSVEAIYAIANNWALSRSEQLEIAVITGRLDYIGYLDTHCALGVDESVGVFQTAIITGNRVDVLRFLAEELPDQAWAINDEVYLDACKYAYENRHFDELKYLTNHAPKQLWLRVDDYYLQALSTAYENAHFDVLGYLINQAPEELQEEIDDYCLQAFANAYNEKRFEVLEKLLEIASEGFQVTLAKRYLGLLMNAVQHGQGDVLKDSLEKIPPQLTQWIENRLIVLVMVAAQSGQLAVLRDLVARVPGQLAAIIGDGLDLCGLVFLEAAKYGQLHVLNYLEENYLKENYSEMDATKKLQHMIEADRFCAFRDAAENGHLAVLCYLAEKASNRLQDMIEANRFSAFQSAAAQGHLDVVKYLAEQAPDRLQYMIVENGFFAFQSAAAQGHLDVVKYLAEQAPDRLQDMIEANEFSAFQSAAAQGHLDVVKYLAEQAPDRLQGMIAHRNFNVLTRAINFNPYDAAPRPAYPEVIDYLLSHAFVFTYAEVHASEHGYGDHVARNIEAQLDALRLEKSALELSAPNAVFDVLDAEKARLLFYVLRHLIRQDTPQSHDKILFLLDIPAVKALAHTEVTVGQSNELLRLALRLNNQTAINRLMAIDSVRTLAQEHGNYEAEQRGALDLRQLAQDRESSLSALTQGERRRLRFAEAHYMPQITQARGSAQCVNVLRADLKKRYCDNPATISVERRTLLLPFFWEEFQALNLQEPHYTQALQAYYRHNDHSAWRYLSKPNHWMHQEAGYVYINEQRNARWASFEDYEPFIALLYLAAKDIEQPALDGYTIESRFELFIKELALIGRAHNWDRSRIRELGEGNQVSEEYDDLEGDRPSCFSGVRRRLFQSVHGHPLLKMLTKEMVIQELNDFMRQHFQMAITSDNKGLIKAAWDKANIGVEDLSPQELAALKSVDLSGEQQARLINILERKYGLQFTEERSFSAVISENLNLRGEEEAHILKFYNLAVQIFKDEPSPREPGAHGLFGVPSSRSDSAASDRDEENIGQAPGAGVSR